MNRPSVISCAVFGGRNPRTGLPVGSRHRWSGNINGAGWGKGSCDFCHRTLDQVLEKRVPKKKQAVKLKAVDFYRGQRLK